jgi:hypothetical protein
MEKINEKKLVPMPRKGNTPFLAFVINAKVVYERYQEWSDGIKIISRKIGKRFPKCCSADIEEDGFYLCSCGQHVVHLHNEEKDESATYLGQIIKLPMKITMTPVGEKK